MRKFSWIIVLGVIATTGCYHATVHTGLTPSGETHKKWASGWVYGLVPPGDVDGKTRCPNGVARVESQVSFANGLVSYLTFGIYTPMTIEYTCAARS